jgi:hypothetical protein
MEELLIHLLRELVLRPATVNEVAAERTRQARIFLNEGCRLLSKGLVDDADVRFGLALHLWPDIVDSLSKRQQRKLMTELARLGGEVNAASLWLELDKQQTDTSKRGLMTAEASKQRVALSVESLILDATEEAQALLDNLYRQTPAPVPDSPLDQTGLRDGASIVRDH